MDIEREDLSIFLNACAVATGQTEFYSHESANQVSLRFLHHYICSNYRELYCQSLAAGVNHFNQAEIIFQLLSSGKDCRPEQRPEENALITSIFSSLPPQRAWKLIERLQKERVNNRRTRSLIQRYIENRKDIVFDCVKYRSKLKTAVLHSHTSLKGELSEFLFKPLKKKFEIALLENYRQAHFSKEAIYQLPYSVAEGFAARHKIPRKEFLDRIQHKMTDRERLRIQSASENRVRINPERLSLTELCVYLLSLDLEERREMEARFKEWIEAAVNAVLDNNHDLPIKGRVAAVLDNSYSASGSRAKRNRPLAVALAAHLLMKELITDYRPFWTHPAKNDLLVHPAGQTHITERILDALEWGADTIVIISDACENDVLGAAPAIIGAYRAMGGKAEIYHLNPVYDPETFQVRSLCRQIPAVGLRAGEELSTSMHFARLSSSEASLSDLKIFLKERVERLLKRWQAKSTRHQTKIDPDAAAAGNALSDSISEGAI